MDELINERQHLFDIVMDIIGENTECAIEDEEEAIKKWFLEECQDERWKIHDKKHNTIDKIVDEVYEVIWDKIGECYDRGYILPKWYDNIDYFELLYDCEEETVGSEFIREKSMTDAKLILNEWALDQLIGPEVDRWVRVISVYIRNLNTADAFYVIRDAWRCFKFRKNLITHKVIKIGLKDVDMTYMYSIIKQYI
jgi:hypothetical protein